MTEKSLCFWVRCAIIAVAIVGLTVCAVWIPISVLGADVTARWVQRIFYWLTSLPCFVALAFGWVVSSEMRKGDLFKEKTAKLVKLAAVMLFIDIVIFFIGTLVFFLLDWNGLLLLYSVVSAVGMIVVLFLFVVSHYLLKAAILQEESEGTI